VEFFTEARSRQIKYTDLDCSAFFVAFNSRFQNDKPPLTVNSVPINNLQCVSNVDLICVWFLRPDMLKRKRI
jgi:hypothetical protein